MTTSGLVDLPMPQMGVSITEGVVISWHVAVGDEVAAEQVVCEIATDKVDTEIVSPVAGVVVELVVAEGDTAGVGEALARLAVDADVAASLPASAVVGANGGSPVDQGPSAGAAAAEDGAAVSFASGACSDSAANSLAGASVRPARAADAVLARRAADGRIPSSPIARRVAASLGVDLAAVRGTGRGGRIARKDVLAAANSPSTARQTTPVTRAGDKLPLGYEDVPVEVVNTSHVRRAIAEHMVRSRQTAAHMTTEVDVDMHHVSLIREELNAIRSERDASRVSYLSFIARAAVSALVEFPALNATFQDERMLLWREVNLGIAVDVPGGLIVPVIRGAQSLTVEGIAEGIADLAERARARKLVPDDMRAGTFTISNPGSVGAVSAPAIINQPQVAILGTPAIVRKPWVVSTADGTEAIVPRPILRLALTFDHRAIDGADATRYVVRVGELLEHWKLDAYR
jgi:pyruvate dehydrogenase E2 component (dihydrolipoamide acetyltransferase)